MKFSSSLRCLAIALVLARSGITSEAAVPASECVHTWQRWEHALTSTRPYESPYANVILRVTYTGPAQRTLRTYGFWDGGNSFRIRCAFPAPGTWQWETECSDISNTGLHHQQGKVEVTPYRGANALFRHGFLKVSDNRRYLTLSDRTPFLWMGDTAWSAPQRANDEEWQAYLPDNEAIEVDLSQFPAPLSGRWFDPMRGRYTALPESIGNQGFHRFTPPAKGDWVLLLQRK